MRFFKDMLSKPHEEPEPEPGAQPEAKGAGFAPDASAWEAAGAGPAATSASDSAAPGGDAQDTRPVRIPRPRPAEDDAGQAMSAAAQPVAETPAAVAEPSPAAPGDGGDLDALRRALLELGDTEDEIDAYLAEDIDDEDHTGADAALAAEFQDTAPKNGIAPKPDAAPAADVPAASPMAAVSLKRAMSQQRAAAAEAPRAAEAKTVEAPAATPPGPRAERPRPEPGRAASARKIWDMDDSGPVPQAAPEAPKQAPAEDRGAAAAPPAAAGRAGRRAGRVKTRLLGFQPVDDVAADIFDTARGEAPRASGPAQMMFPVGWIVVTEGEGRGAGFTLYSGVSQIGRGDDQAIRLNFGDTSISRSNHAAVAYDEETGKFYLGHGGKSNIVRLNGKPVLSTETLETDDEIRIGETTLRFIALCGDDFDWISKADDESEKAAVG